MQADNVPKYPECRSVELADYGFIASLIRKHSSKSSDCCFTNIFSWRNIYEYRISELNGLLIVQGVDDTDKAAKKPFLLQPIGDPEAAAKVAQKMIMAERKRNNTPFLASVSENIALGLGGMENIIVSEDRANWDYIYKSAILADLPGPRYHAKRNLINQFAANFDATTIEMDAKICKEAMEFSDRWCGQKDCDSDEGLARERCAIYQMLAHFEALHLDGIVIRIGGDIAGLAIGEGLTEDTYVIHVEKGDQHCRGIYQFINQKMAGRVSPRYEWINREQDMGVPGLRRAKMSYHPDHFVKKFNAHYKEAS